MLSVRMIEGFICVFMPRFSSIWLLKAGKCIIIKIVAKYVALLNYTRSWAYVEIHP